ncbi:MAG: hypothetical protein ACKVOG_09325 [Rhodoglobus sp.]
MAKGSGAAAMQAAAIRSNRAAATPPTPVRRYTQQDIDAFSAAGRLPRIQIGAGRFATSRPVQVGDPFITPSATAPTRPTSIRQNGEDIPIFYGLPQNVANPTSYGRGGNAAPGADAILQGRAAEEKFGRTLATLQKSESFLETSNLTGKKKDPATYVVGTQARIAALRSARSSLQAISPSGVGQRAAQSTLQRNIEQNLKLAQNQRNQVQNVLGEFRAKQRAAQRVNAEVQSGRRPRRSGGAVIPNLPGFLSPTRKY